MNSLGTINKPYRLNFYDLTAYKNSLKDVFALTAKHSFPQVTSYFDVHVVQSGNPLKEKARTERDEIALQISGKTLKFSMIHSWFFFYLQDSASPAGFLWGRKTSIFF